MRIGVFSIIPALGFALLTGCGGGGGSSPVVQTPVYTGLTTPAVITSFADADALTAGAVGGAQAGAVALGAQVQGPHRGAAPLPALVQALGKLAGGAQPVAAAAGAAVRETLDGACGGHADLSGSSSYANGIYTASGSISANNYCSVASDGSSVYLNGAIQFFMTGTSDQYFQLSLLAPALTVTGNGQTYTYNLNYQCQVTAGVAGGVTLTCVYRAPDGTTYQVLDYQVSVVGYTLSISGQYYDPAYGYVTVTTPSLLTYGYCANTGTDLPVSGTLKVTGANNGYGQFDAQGCQGYQISYNLNDGNGTFYQPYSW